MKFPNEAAFQNHIIALAKALGWKRIYHTFNSQRSGAGFPDLVMVNVKQRRTAFVELKVGRNKPTAAQKEWLRDLQATGQEAYLWHPDALPMIESILKGE